MNSMVNLKSIIRDPFYLSIIATTVVFTLILIFGYRSNLNNIESADYEITFLTLVLHNSLLSLLNIVGLLTFGLLNIYTLFLNAFELGNILNYSVNTNGLNQTLGAFIPHAIFELPSMIISLSLGFVPICFIILKSMDLISSKYSIKMFIKRLVIFTCIVLTLNILAAVVESTLSLHL
ncbi:hypothetical protein CHH69_17365 [Terribacillus saccharophilus]|uniref:stage II sporulation protein M n=1 Tax=Terribacillus saccharophilus TaxID=361277 RepID=UPI000BA62080|nr:stage II sporulation protein M [Terribacillus saccharophilus]PAF23109.1 hypothetical protein CHH49_00675 [Terribacillus saccharophilus]PAF34134.1 hypothetical protein CHH69_17365 [Terribacillus saccharophilus]